MTISKEHQLSHTIVGTLLPILMGYLFLTIPACSPKTSQIQLPINLVDTFSRTGEVELPEQWWTTFEDEQLNEFVSEALDSNFNLQTAWYRLQAAKAIVNREKSYLYPDIFASAQSGISFPQPDFVGGENVRLSLTAEYEVDLWGRISSQVEAEEFRAQATLADYQTAALTVSAEICRTWFLLLEANNQLKIIDDQIATNNKTIESLKNRYAGGQIRAVDILRQQQLLEATREQKVAVETRSELLEHQLSILLGNQPQETITYSSDSLPGIPSLPQTGIPGELVERRPDVQAAYALLQAADRDLATAISNKYPRLSLSASTSLRANQLDNLWESWAYSFGANLLAPLFYGGRLQAEVDRNEAIRQLRLYEFGQTVLIAFQEVEDALIREQKQRERIAILRDQLDLAVKTYEQLRIEYLNGSGDFLDVLTALDEQQQLQRDILTAKQLLLEYRIALYRALAGSIEETE